jgi:1-acyl-sn-glycerol-3-phosphate acyltransferase
MSSKYHISSTRRVIRSILRIIFRIVFRVLSRVRVSGRNNIPSSGGYIIAINHVSYFDVPVLLAFWPVAPEAAGASNLWEKPGISVLAHLYSAIPVHRGQYDRQVIDKVIDVLQDGEPLLLAPEGTRSHTPGMNRASPGVAYVADKAKVPVLPVGMVGSTDDFLSNTLRLKRPLVEMRIGAPFILPELTGKGAELRKARQENTDYIMRKIADLLPQNYQGVYEEEADNFLIQTDEGTLAT